MLFSVRDRLDFARPDKVSNSARDFGCCSMMRSSNRRFLSDSTRARLSIDVNHSFGSSAPASIRRARLPACALSCPHKAQCQFVAFSWAHPSFTQYGVNIVPEVPQQRRRVAVFIRLRRVVPVPMIVRRACSFRRTASGANGVRIVETDQPLSVRRMQRQRIADAMRAFSDGGTRFTTNLTQCLPAGSTTSTTPSSARRSSKPEIFFVSPLRGASYHQVITKCKGILLPQLAALGSSKSADVADGRAPSDGRMVGEAPAAFELSGISGKLSPHRTRHTAPVSQMLTSGRPRGHGNCCKKFNS